MKKTAAFLLLFLLTGFGSLMAQIDTSAVKETVRLLDSAKILRTARQINDSLSAINPYILSSPRRAALLSAVFPGAGQIYNRKLWYIKLPVIYGGSAALGFTVAQYHKQYIRFRDAYLYRNDNNDITVPDPILSAYDNDRLRDVRDNFRRERDYYIILSIGFYLLNVAEAATAAHLQNFDVSDDISLKIKPSAQELPGSQAFGMSLVLSFDPPRTQRNLSFKYN